MWFVNIFKYALQHQQVPDKYPDKSDQPQNAAQHESGKDFPSHDPPPVPDGYFSQGHSLNDQGGSLGAAVSAAGHDQGNKIGQDQHFCQFIIIISHGRGREHFTEKKDDQPADTFADQLKKRRFQIGMIQCFGYPRSSGYLL